MGLLDRLRDRLNPPPAPPGPIDPNAPPAPAPESGGRKRLSRKWLLYGLTMAGIAVAAYFGIRVPIDPPEPPDEPIFSTGWVDDPVEVKAVAATLEFPVFGDTPAGRMADPLPRSAYLWEAHVKVTGSLPEPQNQNPVGSCVGFGTSRAIERSLAVQILRGEAWIFKRGVEEVIYGGSRVTIGGGRIRGDGSVGAWAAKYATEYGHLPRGTYGPLDLSRYDPTRCRQWGDRGVPTDLVADVKKYAVGSTTQVRSWDEAKKALAQGYGIAVCSDQGFAMQRDANGICRASGSWAHCMCLDGFHTAEDGREYGHIENSWGANAHTGPVGWGSPNTAGFWAESSVVNRMLSQGDSWGFSAVKGFPGRKPLDWVRAPARRADPEFALAP